MIKTVNGDLKVFSGNSNRQLTVDICRHLNIEMGKAHVERFADGEVDAQVLESVRGHDCYIVQSTCTPVNENLMELLIMIDAFKRASAGKITAVIPYYGYARADRKAAPRVPITAKLVSNLITEAGADRLMTVDLHAGQIQGFFDIPVDHLRARHVFVDYFKDFKKSESLVVVSPDVGGVERARKFAARMDAGLVIIDKRRPKANEAVVYNIIGDVKDKTCIIFDDIADTAGTLAVVSNKLKENGAAHVYAACSHGILSRNGVDKINNSPIEKLIITDSLPANRNLGPKVEVLSISYLLAEAIRRNHDGMSISDMFK
ncbi:Ribose-phosphate pyrophosphokinase [Elusimicrobium minutum Pei191]|uniref:Ribose-phosphate pyrophosphokinase n=1 Tax=Elusimicrobium minutum (strain Pei191) TaxID=445932 RepID=B2KE96_ELUMP|nr:ribose-phosphate pyrophosphokinase [Elusimicrobium minutum]ACC98842.1 Ribose-phosphate pyrophosphokinase [Elusimicrobium minutum Pei191]